MKKARTWLALLALVALIGAAIAWAESQTQDGQSTRGVQQSSLGGHLYRSDSSQWSNSGDGAGNLYTTEANPDRTFLKKYQSIIQQTLYPTYARISSSVLKGPQADSSSARDMLGANHSALAISYTLDDSTSSALLGIEVRGHLTQNTDSVSTFFWRAWGPRNSINVAQGSAATIRDTLGAIIGPGMGLASGGSFMADTVNALISERPIWLAQTNTHRYIWMPLQDENGAWFAAPYMSIRARLIRVYGASGVAYVGTQAPATVLNVDLVGWR